MVLLDELMSKAYARVGAPLWVYPSEAEHLLRCDNWCGEVAHELGEWFARVWSMAFVAGVRGIRPVPVDSKDVKRLLNKMGYAWPDAEILSALLLDKLPLLYATGQSRRCAELAVH